MNIEIERKFLVNKKRWASLVKPLGIKCRQTYLSSNPDKVVRIRTLGEKGFITIKGKQKGLSRAEFEYEIPIEDANEMIDLFGTNIIDKTRYNIQYKNMLWEVDVFENSNNGLIVAEIELNHEDESFEKPEWIDKEVSNEIKYYNSNLHKNPFKTWK